MSTGLFIEIVINPYHKFHRDFQPHDCNMYTTNSENYFLLQINTEMTQFDSFAFCPGISGTLS